MSGELFQNGQRKYLNAQERTQFLAAADRHEPEVRTLCGVLAFPGCRISEALELTMDRVDLAAGTLIFETLKKRERGVYRAVPAPPPLLDTLDLVHGIRKAQAQRKRGADAYLWTWSRTTAWRRVCDVMDDANLPHPKASDTGSVWQPSRLAFRSTSCSGGSATPSSPRRRSTPTPSDLKSTLSQHSCGP